MGFKQLFILFAIGAGERYGLEIVDAITEATNSEVALPLGSLYTTLHRMEGKGLVRSRWGEATAARRGARRRYYRLTPAGQQLLQEELALWSRVLRISPPQARAVAIVC